MRRLLWPAVLTTAMLVLALWLGVWQVHRLAWKTALLAEIDRGEAAEPIPLPPNPAPFTKVQAEGRLRGDLTARYGVEVRGTPSGPLLGSQVLRPLERPGADPVIVDLGWMPDGRLPPQAGHASIVGYVRPPELPVRFGAADDPVGRRFYALDPAAIGASLGLPRVAPFTLVALGPPGGSPEPAQALPRPANNHLSYALTWFGLAASLLVIFVIHARKVLAE